MSQWSQADVDAINAKRGAKLPAHVPTTKSKYRNVRTNIGGEVFDSKREADYWLILKARQQLGELDNLCRQVRFPLFAPRFPRYPDIAHVDAHVVVSEYVADFTYRDGVGMLHVIDAKGHRTREYMTKKKWLELQSGIVIEEV